MKSRTMSALAAALMLVCADASAQRTYTVSIENLQFEPKALTVKRGDRVVWVNKDLVPHTASAVKSARSGFDSHSIAPDASWTYTASTPGRYAYVCTFHPTMKATLVVE